jgi:hypothetical protein
MYQPGQREFLNTGMRKLQKNREEQAKLVREKQPKIITELKPAIITCVIKQKPVKQNTPIKKTRHYRFIKLGNFCGHQIYI